MGALLENMPNGHAIWRFTITQELRDGTVVLSPAGRLGHAAAADLHRAIEAGLEAGARHVVIDLTQVDYVSSGALLTADAAADRLRAGDGLLILCGLNETVQVTLEVAGWIDRFAIEATREQALGRLAHV